MRVDTGQLAGGTFYDTWTNAQTLAPPTATVTGIDLVVDGAWFGAQSFTFTSVSLNGVEISTVPVPTKDDCKNGGWQKMTDANGNTFKNQGDCVSYFATDGKNTASTKVH
jgi:hypothetical protein